MQTSTPNRIHRVVLSKEAAIEIYKHKLALTVPTSFKSCIESSEESLKGQSTLLAKVYRVSAKTIRDIWNKRSWTVATSHLWRSETKPGNDTSNYFVSLRKLIALFGTVLCCLSCFVTMFAGLLSGFKEPLFKDIQKHRIFETKTDRFIVHQRGHFCKHRTNSGGAFAGIPKY
jgi:hypothetical protein